MARRGETIEQLLRTFGPSTSSVLARELAKSGVSPGAARQAVARAARSDVTQDDLRLPKGESFLLLPEQRNTRAYYEAVRAALKSTRAAAGWALECIAGRGGRIPLQLFHSKSGSPREAQRGHVPSHGVLEVLERTGVVERRGSSKGPEYIQFGDQTSFRVNSERKTRAVLLAEDVLLTALKDWTEKLGIVAFEKGAARSDDAMPRIGAFEWDFGGPSYLVPMASRRRKEVVPGFVAADICLGSRLDLLAIQFALKKGAAYRLAGSARPLMQILLADGYEPDAFRAGKGDGIMMATPGNLFGDVVAVALRELITVLTEATQKATVDADRLYGILRGLSQTEGAAFQIRGPLFELATLVAVSILEPGKTRLAERARDSSGNEADIDVLVFQEDIRTLAIECKGKQGSGEVDHKTVHDWLTRQVPRIDEHVLAKYRPTTRQYQLWTTGALSSDASAYLAARKSEIKKYDVACLTGPEVKSYFLRTKNAALSKLLDEFYLASPVARLRRGAAPSSGSA